MHLIQFIILAAITVVIGLLRQDAYSTPSVYKTSKEFSLLFSFIYFYPLKNHKSSGIMIY